MTSCAPTIRRNSGLAIDLKINGPAGVVVNDAHVCQPLVHVPHKRAILLLTALQAVRSSMKMMMPPMPPAG